MKNNEVLTSLRDILKANDERLIEIYALADVKVLPPELAAWLKPEGAEGFQKLSDKMTAIFLNAVITLKRGKNESEPARAPETTITNNLILKKLRIAFELKENDLVALTEKSAPIVPLKEWSAYFRSEGHKHFRKCPDSFLESILNALKT